MFNMVHHIRNHLLSQGGRFGQGSLWVSVSFLSEHIRVLVLVALPQVAEQVLQSDQSPDDSPVTKIHQYYISVCIQFRLEHTFMCQNDV